MAGGRDEQLGRWVYRLAPIALPPLLFVLLRPDWYYELNRIDSYFYAGYAQNLGYLLKVAGQQHYFVSRWPLYLPERFFFLLFGAKAGFLAFRWIMAATVTAVMMRLGRRTLRWQVNLALTTLMLIMPMYLRTLLNGYGDSLAVTLGFLAIATVAMRPSSHASAVSVGIAGALIFSINPVYSSIVLAVVAVWLFEKRGWVNRLKTAGVVGATAVLVCLVGFLLMRFAFDVPNVYRPLLHALNEFKDLHDRQKSSQLWWMGYRIWIYLPAALLMAWAAATRWYGITFTQWERFLLRVCALQYLFQIWYQFSRHGDTLEISYYWSPMVPSFLLALWVLVGKFATARRNTSSHVYTLPILVGIVVLYVLALRTNMLQVYGHWLDAVIIVGALVYLWRRGRQRWHSFAACSLALVVFTFQTGAPRGEPTPPGETAIRRINALYNTVYDSSDSYGIDAFRAATWFRKELHGLGSNVEEAAYFYTGSDGISDVMGAMYQVQFTDRWLDPKFDCLPTAVGVMDQSRADLVRSGAAKVVVLAGTDDEVNGFETMIESLRPGAVTIFDAMSPNKTAVRVRVLQYA